jgi:Acyl-CoA dehydrogenase, C-terminal domain
VIQVHGGDRYSLHLPFEHVWRHFRRCRITEGSEEVQMRKFAKVLFGLGETGATRGRGEGGNKEEDGGTGGAEGDVKGHKKLQAK